ncbi:MAG: dihydrofolate reductase [Phenylobacterium sp.]
MIRIIVAVDENGLIGDSENNCLPWDNKEEIEFFKRNTIYDSLIMGRKTWQSLSFDYLEDRLNLVITKQPEYWERQCEIHPIYGPWFFETIDDAIEFSKLYKAFNKNISIIGGQQLFVDAIEKDLVECIGLSRVHGAYQGDIYFPVDLSKWFVVAAFYDRTFDYLIYAKKEKEKCD